jgi:hypothetical protein
MDAETAYYLAGVYKAKADAVVKHIQFWGEHLPPKHKERLEAIRSSYECMKSDMRRSLANAEPSYRADTDQILLWIRIIDSES